MPAQPPAARAQTLRQAKASYRARGRPSISEAEKKALERAVELERRAWRLKEAEKRKADAIKKRAEKEKKDHEEQANAQLGSQCRIDKFGYKSSQMHLGAFLAKPRPVSCEQKENFAVDIAHEEEDFGDLDVDDATLLESLEGRRLAVTTHPTYAHDEDKAVPNAERFTDLGRQRASRQLVNENLEEFLDGLGSSTQIARELDADDQIQPTFPSHAATHAEGLDEDDFSFDEDDLAELEIFPVDDENAQEARKLMPPPRLPSARTVSPYASDVGFTCSQLEQLFDDDIQLTQTEPG